MRSFDVIVIGLGGMGSAALWHAAARGLRVLGIEQFDIGHDRGSSHGDTRIIRRAYFEHPDYVPLVDRSFALWRQLESSRRSKLYTGTGLLLMGYPQDPLILGTRLAASRHHLDIQDVNSREAETRFPGFKPAPDMDILFEPDSGYLAVEDCVRACVEEAKSHGAEVLTNHRVVEWSSDGKSVVVQIENERFTADRLIVCAGPWASSLLGDLGLPLHVRRKPVFWFAPKDDTYSVSTGSPTFAIENHKGFFYGFPQVSPGEVKVAEHSGGEVVDDVDAMTRIARPGEHLHTAEFVREFMPRLSDRLVRHSICMYTMTPDEHFIIDRHPRFPNVAFAAGFSGHGFKFSPIVGKVLTDLVVDGRCDEPVGFLSLNRLTGSR